MIQVGQKVELSIQPEYLGFGGLNPIMLRKEGYIGGTVDVVKAENGFGLVKLPSGYEVWITEKDII